jgi:Leucine-rich repeat (LRR) protein
MKSDGLIDFSMWIKSNGLNSIVPVDVETLKKLSVLDLSKQKLRELPVSIGSLENLTVLKISGNRLKKLAEQYMLSEKHLRKFAVQK